jgi:hypothetical protein
LNTLMRYTTLSLSQVTEVLRDVARETQETFGALDEEQLNWRPDATRWSIAQCFDHLVTGNHLLLLAARSALEHPRTSVWQRVPLLPAAWGGALIRTQGPDSGRKFAAPARARPASRIRGDIIQRFVDQHREAESWTRGLDEGAARRTIMISPFIRFVAYSVLDALRLWVAHDRRHFEQARRVLQSRK